MAEVRVRRRLAAILAADVVGYSRLMHEDETRTRARYNALLRELIEPAIAGHGGRVVKTMGDGFLAEFSSVVDAVQCASDIQRAMPGRNAGEPEDRAIRFRIGVNLGDVIVEDDDIHLAYAMLSRTYSREIAPGRFRSPEVLDKAHDFANKAVALDPSLPQAYFSLAFVQRLRNEIEEAVASAEKAIKLSPNYADGYSLLANIFVYAGKPERSIPLVQDALQLSPHAPAIHLMVLGQSYFALERYEDAIRAFRRGI